MSGFGTGESPRERREHLLAASAELPEAAPRMLVGPLGSPDEV